MEDIGKIFSLFGVIFLLLGLWFNFLKPSMRRIPGDIYIERFGFQVYIPFTSAILLTVILTLLFNYFRK